MSKHTVKASELDPKRHLWAPKGQRPQRINSVQSSASTKGGKVVGLDRSRTQILPGDEQVPVRNRPTKR